MAYVTDEVRKLIGVEGPRFTAPAPLGADELRRFVQAAMEENPLHWDAEAARASRYGEVVATPLFPVHVARRAPGTPDPFDRFADDPDWDGLDVATGFGGLPPVEVGLSRILNGGTEAEFHQLARVGDTITAQSRYADITEREGSSGPMVLVTIETTYTNQDDAVLVRSRSTVIMR
jgi:acyl dehydratase